MKNLLKLLLISIAILSPIYAYQDNFMINNQSSCTLEINPAISNKFIPSAPKKIGPHTQTPITFDVNETNCNVTLLEYTVYCDGNYPSGKIGMVTQDYIVFQYTVSTNPNLFLSIDYNDDFQIYNR